MMIIIAVTFLVLISYSVDAQKKPCEVLVDCLEDYEVKHKECFSNRPNKTTALCLNHTLHNELEQLLHQKTESVRTCLKENMKDALDLDKSKKKYKRCESIIRNRGRAGARSYNNKNSAAKKRKSMKYSCFQDVRRIRNECSQIARCCNISKMCHDTNRIDQEIERKRRQVRKALLKCRREKRRGRKGRKLHLIGHHKKVRSTHPTEFHLI